MPTAGPDHAVGVLVAAAEPLGRRRQVGDPFGPGAGLEAVEERGLSALDDVTVVELGEELGDHLDAHRRRGSFTLHDLKTVLGLGPGARRPPRGTDPVALRTCLEQSLGMLDAFALDESQRGTPWRRDDVVARRMLAYFSVAWLRLVQAGLLPADDVARFTSRAGSRLAVRAQQRPTPDLPALVAAPTQPADPIEPTATTDDLVVVDRDAPTLTDRLRPGAVIGEGAWRLRIEEVLRTSSASGGSCLYRVARTVEPVGLPLVLKVPNLPRSERSPSTDHLPTSDFVMRPIVRLDLGDGRNADALPRARIDVHTWWRKRRAEGGPMLDGREVATLAAPMAAGLVAMHTGRGGVAPLVHSDIKISQFLIGAASGAALQISDLDLAVPALILADGDEAPTTVPSLGHTLGYLAPGPVLNVSSRQHDVWALATCWHMLLAEVHPAEVAAEHELTDHERYTATQGGATRLSEGLDEPWAQLLGEVLIRRRRMPATELLERVLALYDRAPLVGRSVVGTVAVDPEWWLVTEPGGDERVRCNLVYRGEKVGA